MKNIIGIYKITSPSKKIYIGQSVSILKRWSHYKRGHAKSQSKLNASFKKYGVNNHIFEILTECKVEDLNKMERYFQDVYGVTNKNGLNLKIVSDNDFGGYHTEESKEKMSIAQKIAHSKRDKSTPNPLKGRKRSKEVVEKVAIGNRGKKRTFEQRMKMRQSQLLIKEKTAIRMREYMTGRKMSDETKAKMSLARKGRKLPIQTIEKMKKNGGKLVLDTNTGVYYNTLTELCNLIKKDRNTLSFKLRGICKNNTQYIYV